LIDIIGLHFVFHRTMCIGRLTRVRAFFMVSSP